MAAPDVADDAALVSPLGSLASSGRLRFRHDGLGSCGSRCEIGRSGRRRRGRELAVGRPAIAADCVDEADDHDHRRGCEQGRQADSEPRARRASHEGTLRREDVVEARGDVPRQRLVAEGVEHAGDVLVLVGWDVDTVGHGVTGSVGWTA